MAQQIKKKFIGPDQIDGSKIKLLQGQSIRGTNSLGEEVDLVQLSSEDKVEVLGQEVALKSDVEQESQERQAADQDLQSQIDDVDGYAQELRSDLDDLDGYAQEIRSDLDEEVIARQQGDAALGQSIEALESDLEDEVEARIAGDGATLEAAKAHADSQDVIKLSESKEYTDQKIADLVGAAPELLDTLEEIAEALQDEQSATGSILTQLSDQEGRLDSLEPKVSDLQSFGYDQIIHVSKNGIDTNSGKQHFPFLTISAAMGAITDASPSKRYVIKVAPGAYSEAQLTLKANVFIVGEGNKESVRITGAVSMDSSFSGSGDHRSGFANVTLLSAANFDWSAVTSAAGKLYITETVFGSTLNLYGHNNAIAQAQFNSCVIFGNLTISGVNVGVFTDNVCFGNVTLNQHPNNGMATILVASGGQCNGTLTQNAPVNDFNRRSASFLRAFPSEKVVLNGPAVYADVDLISQGKQAPDQLNGANLIALTPRVNHDLTTRNLNTDNITSALIKPKATNTHNMGDWGMQWFWNFGYVHASSGTDLFLISYPASFAPDSSGKSIGIYTDGAGLQENVDGGNIAIVTAQTSGTGVRGKITLNGKEIDVTSKQIKNLADGTSESDAVNKGQLDSGVEEAKDESKEYTDQKIADLIGSAPEILDTLGEIAEALQDEQSATGAILTQLADHEQRIEALEGQEDGPFFSNGSLVVGEELAYVDLDKEYIKLMSVAVGRLAVHEGQDYTVSVVDGKTRLTWINSLANPDGEEKIETGDKVFWVGAHLAIV